jgi:hypothetical protein
MIVKPKEGVRVLKPDTLRPLPPEGIEVADDNHDLRLYWARRAAQGDVELIEKE